MGSDSSVDRVRYLEAKIREARHLYYNERPVVTDEVYDAWRDELAELHAASKEVTDIGAPTTGEWPKVEHGFVMGSLDKVNLVEEMTDWVLGLARHGVPLQPVEPLLVTEKLDGISIHLRYAKGAFSQAVTRGDGLVGEDISRNVVQMQGVPGRIDKSFTGSMRGEIVIFREQFQTHFQQTYANTRNAASGIARRSDGVGCNHLTVMLYQVVDAPFETEGEQFEWLEKQGFKVPNWYVTAMAPGVKTPQDLWLDYQQSKRDALPYDIDGLVVRLDHLGKQVAMGETHGRPHGAVAFKFAPITRETVLRKVEWQVGGTGRITPVAFFDPVNLVGASVAQSSLYNLRYIRDLGLTIGSRIIVARANDVIPRVAACVHPSTSPMNAPRECPACGASLEMGGEYLVCPNIAGCPAQRVGRIQRYVKALDIKEWGEALIERLVEAELVSTPADLYRLSEDTLAGVDRMGIKSAQTVLKTLWAKNPVPLDELLGALSIPGIAAATIRMVMDHGIDTWYDLQDTPQRVFEHVPGLGPVKAESLYKWLSGPGKGMVLDLLSAGVEIQRKIVGSLTGQSFCFTGTMKTKRKVLEEMVTIRGGVVKPSVSKGLTYLVLADSSSGSTKAQAAKKYGTECISEDDFLKLVQ
ncbi:MAG: NAD-dependent DNA ligase LigA [Parcubacteria group bacterium]|jgi:DNA ligase (NAD+)